MKNIISKLAILLAAALVVASCIRNDVPVGDPNGSTGELVLSELDFSEAIEILHKTRAGGVSAENFQVCITKTSTGREHLSCKYKAVPEKVVLPIGEYQITVQSHEVQDAGWDEPYYAVTKAFEITKGAQTTVEDLVCCLANIMVSVNFTDQMIDLMGDDCKVMVRIGNGELDYRLDDVSHSGFFKARDVDPTDPKYDILFWEFTGDIENQFLEDSGSIPNVKAGEHRTLIFNLNRTPTPGANEGDVKFIFTVSVEVETVNLDLNIDITERVIEELDPAVSVTSEYSLTERTTLIKDEPMADLLVNIGSEECLRNIFVAITTDNEDFAAALAVDGLDGTFDLAAPGDKATVLTEKYGLLTGSAIVDKTLVNLDFSEFAAMAYGFGNTDQFDIRITAYDSEMNLSDKTLRLKFVSVPPPIIIEWEGRDIDKRQTFNRSEVIETIDDTPVCNVPVKILINAERGEGIKNFVVEIISSINGLGPEDLGELGLAAEFDLAYPGDLDSGLARLGFPTGSAVIDQTELMFNITEFVPLIFALRQDGYADFKLTITDNAGNVESKTIQLNIFHTR